MRILTFLVVLTALLLPFGNAYPQARQAAPDEQPLPTEPIIPDDSPTGNPVIDEPGGLPDGYELVWADEFDAGTLPDPARWDYDTRANPTGWANEELQYYAAARPENSRIENGLLIIEARRESATQFEDNGGQGYTSARLVTRGLAEWTYGFFEVRARLPCAIGTWPAIWLLGTGPGRWPQIGEIDIMEHVGFQPGLIHGNINTSAYNFIARTNRGNHIMVPDACDAFHRYQLTWTPEYIRIGVDDRDYMRFLRVPDASRDEWPFDEPEYVILNIAVGGIWGGLRGIDDASFPARMEVDYVRVYQHP